MNDEQLARWLALHGGEVGRKNNERTEAATADRRGNPIPARRVIDSTTIEAADGASITLRRNTGDSDQTYERVAETPPDKSKTAPVRTPEEHRREVAAAQLDEEKWNQQVRDNNERSWNATAPGGSGRSETHAERAARELKEAQERRAQEDQERQRQADAARVEAQREETRQRNLERMSRESEGERNRELQRQEIALRERQANKPDFLSQATDKNPYIVRYDPTTGQIIKESNPNYDAVKAAAEEKRQELEIQIRQRTITLEEGKAAYTQWFQTNVETPLKLAQEARAKAEEKRQALEAEERRRQFAADFGLRKATLGESAAARATQAEISLLPYRAGPTEAAEMSSAINSLAAGGKINGPDASAGIHFTPGAFQFAAPDFAKIAKNAAKAALSGLTDYRPSDEEFPTADYSGVPAVNLGNMPSLPGYNFTPPDQQQQQ